MENKKINANSYDLLPTIYDIRGFFILSFAYRNSIFRQLRFFAENMKEKHLECAIGTGSFTKLCLLMKRLIGNKTQTQLVGVDYSEALMGGAKKKLKHCELKIEAILFETQLIQTCEWVDNSWNIFQRTALSFAIKTINIASSSIVPLTV